MSNEEIAKELLSVLKDKMMYREGLPSDGWAVEVISNALVAAQQSVEPTLRTVGDRNLDEVIKQINNIGNG